MIHTRQTIYDTLIYKLKRLIKQADNDKVAFKKILYAIIINDMKEWAEYKGFKSSRLDFILKEYLQNECLFKLVRFQEGLDQYKNVNIPQSNSYWQRIFDSENSELGHPELVNIDQSFEWEIDPNCNPVMVYFTSVTENPIDTLKQIYGLHGELLTTVCEKMNTYIDRVTGRAYYLDCSGNWLPVIPSSGITEDIVKDIVIENRGNIWHSFNENGDLVLDIKDDSNNQIASASNEEINNIL